MSNDSKRTLDFGRNVNLDRLDKPKWDEIMEHELFKNVNRKELFLLCMSIGYKSGNKLDIKESYPTINFLTIDDEQKYIMGAFGLAVGGEDVLKENGENKIKAESYMYAKGGFEIIKGLIDENPDPLDAAKEILLKIKTLKND